MATRSLNKVILIGNLTRDPELRYTPQGTAVCTFGLATNRSWVPSDGGERREETEFHRIVSWQKLAELCAQLLFKGRKVYVEGRLQTRDWTSSDGTQRRTTEIVIDDMIILDSKRPPTEAVAGEGMIFEGEAPQQVPTTDGGVAAAGVTPAAETGPAEVSVEELGEKKKAEKKKEGKVSGVKPKSGVLAKTKKPEVQEEDKEDLNADDIPF